MANRLQISVLEAYTKGSENAHVNGDGLCIRELPLRGKLLLQTRTDAQAACVRIAGEIGLDLPLEANTVTENGHSVLWLGPAKWLIVGNSRSVSQLAQRLQARLAGFTFHLADVSDARVGIEVSGQHALDLLARVCALDLDVSSFGPGCCAQSQLARIPLLLHQVDRQPAFHLYVDRSLAHYAWDWLTDAATGFTAEREAR